MGLFSNKEAEEFARQLANEMRTRVPPSLARAETDKALKLVTSRGREYRKSHKVTILRQIGLSRTFQDRLAGLGYENDFIREATLTLARAMREKSE